MTEIKTDTYIAKTFSGLEDVLYQEIISFGGTNVLRNAKSITFDGSQEVLYKANLWSRVALRIFKQVDTFEVKTEDQLYQYLRGKDWSQWMNQNSTYAVDVALSPNTPSALKNAAEAAKDAIFNYFRDNYKSKPTENVTYPDCRVNLHFFENKCNFIIDSSGESLYKRGYRAKMPSAPINECMAAGLILLTGWNGECNLIDPMCGSGTLLLEAAMIAKNIAPRMNREEYLFKNWKDFNSELWERLKEEAKNSVAESKCMIYGSDVSNKVLGLCKENILKSGLRETIRIKQCPFELYEPPKDGGILVFNPPSTAKLKINDKRDLYKMIGTTLKNQCRNMDAWILCTDSDDIKNIGIVPSIKISLLNGNTENIFAKFEIK